MIRTTTILSLVAAATLQTSFAQAQSVIEPESRVVNVKVKYTDLDLGKPEDAHILYLRLKSAAKRACGPVNISFDRGRVMPTGLQNDYKACVANALADVVTRLNDPLVSRIYAENQKAKSVDVASR